jgi:hypothetical protein
MAESIYDEVIRFLGGSQQLVVNLENKPGSIVEAQLLQIPGEWPFRPSPDAHVIQISAVSISNHHKQ